MNKPNEREVVGFGPTFVEALYDLADKIEKDCPAAVPAWPYSEEHELLAWAGDGRWNVSVTIKDPD